jgi:hypothetical protein
MGVEVYHVWEDFLKMESFLIYGRTTHIGEVFPYTGNLGTLLMCGKTSHTVESFPYLGRLSIYGKSSYICEVVPCMRSLPIQGKSSHIWEALPCMGRHPSTTTYKLPTTCYQRQTTSDRLALLVFVLFCSVYLCSCCLM